MPHVRTKTPARLLRRMLTLSTIHALRRGAWCRCPGQRLAEARLPCRLRVQVFSLFSHAPLSAFACTRVGESETTEQT